jgi:hypothetical protein
MNKSSLLDPAEAHVNEVDSLHDQAVWFLELGTWAGGQEYPSVKQNSHSTQGLAEIVNYLPCGN